MFYGFTAFSFLVFYAVCVDYFFTKNFDEDEVHKPESLSSLIDAFDGPGPLLRQICLEQKIEVSCLFLKKSGLRNEVDKSCWETCCICIPLLSSHVSIKYTPSFFGFGDSKTAARDGAAKNVLLYLTNMISCNRD